MAALALGPARLLVEDGTVGGEDLGAGRTWSLLPPCRSYRDRGDGPWLLRYLGEDDDDDKGQFEWSSDIEDLRTGLAAAMEMTMTPMSGLETWNTLISSDSILSRRLSSCVSQAKEGSPIIWIAQRFKTWPPWTFVARLNL